MYIHPTDYYDIIFRVLFTVGLISGITCTIYGGLNTTMQSRQNGPNEQILIAGICILVFYAILILLSLMVIIYEKCKEPKPNLQPIIVVKRRPKPPSAPIPKNAYRSFKEFYAV